MTDPRPDEAEQLLHTLTRALCAVGVLALVFTAVNVTLFAASRGVPIWIAALLDPMLALPLAVILYADARLAAWGIRPPNWSTALPWWAGCTAAVMNTWTSLWPDGRIGWPRHADAAGVLLHLVPCMLLIGLAETIAAYRKIIAEVHHSAPPALAWVHAGPLPHPTARIEVPPDPPPHPAGPVQVHPAPLAHPDAPALPDHPRSCELGATPVSDQTGIGPAGPHVGDVGPGQASPVYRPDPSAERPAEGDLFTRARALDKAVRHRTGHPVSIRQLRRDLHLGQDRARALRTRLDELHPAGAPVPEGVRREASDQER